VRRTEDEREGALEGRLERRGGTEKGVTKGGWRREMGRSEGGVREKGQGGARKR